jgi:hypothetical protein
MEHDVDAVDRARRQRATRSSAGAQEMSVDIVDVDGGQLAHRQVTE